jgi:hypothetical protein
MYSGLARTKAYAFRNRFFAGIVTVPGSENARGLTNEE